MTNKLLTEIEQDDFWFGICESLFDMMPSFRHIRYNVHHNPVARLIGWLPYLAETEQPFRDSITNMSIYLLSSYGSSREVFSLNTVQCGSIYNSLMSLMNFTSGDYEILKRGMSLICMVLLNDCRNIIEEDRRQGHYNPLSTGLWDYGGLMEEYENNVRTVSCLKMDRILSLDILPYCHWNP